MACFMPLIYTAHGIVLAPFYDVLSTAVYPNLTDKMSMKIGSKYQFSEGCERTIRSLKSE